jgi:hypothetical protein
MAPTHAAAGLWLASSYTALDPGDKRSVQAYYRRIWDLFYLEYLMYPFI